MRPIVPSSSIDLRARVAGDEVELVVRTTAQLRGSIRELRLLRRDPKRELLSVVVERRKAPDAQLGGVLVWRFRLTGARVRGFEYRAALIGRDRLRHRLSPALRIEAVHLPGQAPRPTATIVARAVVLRWQPRPGLRGYWFIAEICPTGPGGF